MVAEVVTELLIQLKLQATGDRRQEASLIAKNSYFKKRMQFNRLVTRNLQFFIIEIHEKFKFTFRFAIISFNF